MTPKQFEKIKAAGVKKWAKGAVQTEEAYAEWMNRVGSEPCSFCANFSCLPGETAIACPLSDDTHCAKEYNEAYNASLGEEANYPAFIVAALALRDRIAALKYEDLKNA